MAKWQVKYPKLCDWVEANIEETFSFYRLPAEHHRHMKSSNMLERINQEVAGRLDTAIATIRSVIDFGEST